MNDVDVILIVDADANRVAEQPVVRHRLGPHRIDLEARRLHLAVGLRVDRPLQQVLSDAERDDERQQAAADNDVPFHRFILHKICRQRRDCGSRRANPSLRLLALGVANLMPCDQCVLVRVGQTTP